MTNGSKFLFSCFQLNTLNYKNNDGIKNFVWFSSDGDQPMYNKIVPKRAMLRNTRYEDYDPDVFRQILTFYANGANLMLPPTELSDVSGEAANKTVSQ
jgi:large subunit ribosomal protein L37